MGWEGARWAWVGLRPGRVRRGYIRVVRPIFLSFLKIFLSLPFSDSRFSLFSLLLSSSSPMGGKGGRRWRHRRCKHLLFLFFLLLSTSFFLLYAFPDLKLPHTNDMGLDLNEKRRKKLYFLFVIFGADCMLVCDWSEWFTCCVRFWCLFENRFGFLRFGFVRVCAWNGCVVTVGTDSDFCFVKVLMCCRCCNQELVYCVVKFVGCFLCSSGLLSGCFAGLFIRKESWPPRV